MRGTAARLREDRVLEIVWTREFISGGLCGLCGNNGLINTRVVSPAGQAVELNNAYCICPNGRALRRRINQKRPAP